MTLDVLPARPLRLGRHVAVLMLAGLSAAGAQTCRRDGSSVICDDGRQGMLSGPSIIWSDGTRSSAATQHPSVIIGNKASVHIGPGVFVDVELGGPETQAAALDAG